MVTSHSIMAIVEGPGDKDAVPALLRRILWERFSRYDIDVPQPRVAHGKPNLIKKLEDFLRYALIEGCTAILILLDADTDCPTQLARELAQRAATLNLRVPIAVACAKHEYEAWFISCLSTDEGDNIRQRLGIPSSVTAPEDVESVGNAKAWLENHMPHHLGYKETTDQVVLTHYINLELAHDRSRSFRRVCHAVAELVEAIDYGISAITPS